MNDINTLEYNKDVVLFYVVQTKDIVVVGSAAEWKGETEYLIGGCYYDMAMEMGLFDLEPIGWWALPEQETK